MNILEEAGSLINGERQQQYGSATEAYERLAAVWSGYLGTELTALDTINLLVLMKVCRARSGYHRDSYVDTAGYAAIGERLHHEAAQQLSSVERKVWHNYADIPPGVRVEDVNGERWGTATVHTFGATEEDKGKGWLRERNDKWGPFTEALDG